MKYLLLIFFWIAFGTLHSFLISASFIRWLTGKAGKGSAFHRLFYNILALLSFGLILMYTNSIGGPLIIKFNYPLNYLQYFLLAFSVFLIILAFFTYDTLEFIGLKQVMDYMNPEKSREQSHVSNITKKGLLGIIRHPMYLATIIFMWSLNSNLADIITHIILTVYIFIGIIFEERKLIIKFGDEYKRYKSEVPMLIPFIK